MTTDTSAEALERMADWLFGTLGTNAVQDTLRALAAEKRRAREGVTEELVTAAETAYDKVILALPDCDPSDLSRKDAMRAALEAVWPDAKDAKDAERYRWLSEIADTSTFLNFANTNNKHELDTAIDAAMQESDHV